MGEEDLIKYFLLKELKEKHFVFKFTFLLKFAYRPCELFSDILIPIPIKHYYCLVFIYRVTKTSSNVWTKLLHIWELKAKRFVFVFQIYFLTEMVDRRCELGCVSSTIRSRKLRKRTADISKACHLKTKGHTVENPEGL